MPSDLLEPDLARPSRRTFADEPKESSIRIAVFGLFGSANFGNEATLTAFIHNVRLRLPSAKFVCIAPRHSTVEDAYGFRHIDLDPWPVAQSFWRVRPASLRTQCVELAEVVTEPARRRRAGGWLNGVSALVVPGTGLIDDFGQRAQDMPTHLDRWTRAAKERGIPLCYVSVGVSTVMSRLSRTLFRRSLARADYCSFRDGASAANATELGYSATSPIFPDLAFSLPNEWLSRERAPASRRVIGVGIMGYYGWNRQAEEGRRIYGRYLNKICELITTIVADGHDVRLLIGDARADTGTASDVMMRCDADAVRSGRVMAPSAIGFRDVLGELSRTDLVVATRFHNILLSLMLERPTISIGYSDKNDALMADFGLDAYCHDIETFRVDSVMGQLSELVRLPHPSPADLALRLAGARSSLNTQYDELCDLWTRVATWRIRFDPLAPLDAANRLDRGPERQAL